jgi:hypothetical protein
LQLDVVHFTWLPAPLKEKWCPHHVLCLFFVSLVWNSSMAFWACSISDSFTQDAFIGWYPFHLTKYSYFCALSYLDLSATSTSNSGSLWTKFGGGFELCSRLGLEASQATDFKRKTWNVGWTLRFSGSSNLNGPKNLWLKPFSNQKFLMCNHTSSPSWNFTFHWDLSAKSLYLLCAFPSWLSSFPTSAAFFHQVVWPRVSQPHFEGSVRMKLTLLKLGFGSPSGLLKFQSSIVKVKTPCIGMFFTSLESYWSVDVENGLAWAIWTFAAQVMAKRRAQSQIGSLTPNH